LQESEDTQDVMNGLMKQLSFWMFLIIIVVLVLTTFQGNRPAPKSGEPEFVEQLEKDNVEHVDIREVAQHMFSFKVKFRKPLEAKQDSMVFNREASVPEAWRAKFGENKVTYTFVDSSPMWQSLLLNFVPFVILLFVFWFFMIRQMQGGSNKALSFGKSRARLVNHSDKVVTFNDVAGVDEAKEELQEIIEFLKDPKRFSRLGGRIPKGVLLVGPPGTGKTLLARAVAGEAHVPFFSISGSDFVEMFVGVGASRVRDLFQQGQKHAPCIIFIDEIDAVGRQRGAGLGGGHDEREQTLNQLLVEMDGFNTNEGVILMAATNRPDVLDRALLRPGRFDRQVVVSNPDIKGREAILNIHIRNNRVPIEDEVSIGKLARGTSGFSGADLANLVNEAALLAARRNQDKVDVQDLEDAKDRVLMGPERRSMVISTQEKKVTAFHEAGHVLMGLVFPNGDPVHKATIIPRGPSLGLTSFLPEEDRHNYSKTYCLAKLRMAMGGRAAEDVVFGDFTSGASGDLKMATDMTHAMVCQWGMSELGPIAFGTNSEVFLGRDIIKERNFSEETSSAVDKSIHRFLEEAYADAKENVVKYQHILTALAEALIEKETLDAEEIYEIARAHGGAHLTPPPAPKEPPKPAPKPVISTPKVEVEKHKPIDDIPPGSAVPGTA
jgi:cell division protease FtsH